MQETRIQSLPQKDSLGKEMATHSNILAWEIPWTEQRSLAGYSPWGSKVRHDLATEQKQENGIAQLMLMQANLSVLGTFKVESLSYDVEIRRDKCFLDKIFSTYWVYWDIIHKLRKIEMTGKERKEKERKTLKYINNPEPKF